MPFALPAYLIGKTYPFSSISSIWAGDNASNCSMLIKSSPVSFSSILPKPNSISLICLEVRLSWLTQAIDSQTFASATQPNATPTQPIEECFGLAICICLNKSDLPWPNNAVMRGKSPMQDGIFLRSMVLTAPVESAEEALPVNNTDNGRCSLANSSATVLISETRLSE